MATETGRAEAIARVVASAKRLGVELDEREAVAWIAAMESEAGGGDLVVDVDTGVYGHRVTMLDFQPEDLARFREMSARSSASRIGRPQVMTALSISGSAAQSKINAYPADCDFFERVHIQADTREEACAILADLMREKALATAVGPTHRLWEVKFGSHPVAATKGGSPVSRRLADVVDAGRGEGRPDGGDPAGRLDSRRTHGRRPRTTRAGASSTGSSPTRRAASWPTPATSSIRRGRRPTAPSCRSTASSTPTTRRSTSSPSRSRCSAKLVKELSADSVDDYVDTLEHEVWKYTVKDPNFGKAARRMYNVFRMNGMYGEAAYIRELFDEPVTALYQVSALIRTLDDAASSGDTFDTDDDGRAGRRADHVGHPGARWPGRVDDGRPSAAGCGTRSRPVSRTRNEVTR